VDITRMDSDKKMNKIYNTRLKGRETVNTIQTSMLTPTEVKEYTSSDISGLSTMSLISSDW
ncbi:8442_t:CDS:1, partial [Gigaspora margarita]